jgi:hypothetical protein
MHHVLAHTLSKSLKSPCRLRNDWIYVRFRNYFEKKEIFLTRLYFIHLQETRLNEAGLDCVVNRECYGKTLITLL